MISFQKKPKMDYSVKERLEAVHNFLELDFDRTSDLRDIVELAAQLCNIPIALVTLLDENENWLKIRSCVTVEVGSGTTACCQYVIPQNHLPIEPEYVNGTRSQKKSMVQTDPRLRFYAGVPLILTNGLEFGTLCLLDVKTDNITELQQKTLTIFSRQITVLMELGMSHLLLKMQIKETVEKNKTLQRIAHIQSHDVRQPLASIMGLVNLIRDGDSEVNEEWLEMITEATNTLDKRIHEIVNQATGSKRLNAPQLNNTDMAEDAILLIDPQGNIESGNDGGKWTVIHPGK